VVRSTDQVQAQSLIAEMGTAMSVPMASPEKARMRFVSIVYVIFGWGALLLGAWILVDPNSLGGTNPTMRTPFGILLILYGLFRLYTAWKNWKKGGSGRVPLGSSRERSFYKGRAESTQPDKNDSNLPQ
jgi:hypothetical protein